MTSSSTKANAIDQVREATDKAVDSLAAQAKDAAEQLADNLAASAKELAVAVIDIAAGRVKDAAQQALDKVADFSKTLAAKAKDFAGSLTGRVHPKEWAAPTKISSNGYHEPSPSVDHPSASTSAAA